MLLQHFKHGRRQQKYGNQVGHNHEAVEGVGHVPHKAQIHRRAHNGDEGVGDVEGQNDLAAEQELRAPGTVQSPADDSGEGKAAHGNGCEDGHPATVDGGEAGDGQLRASGLTVRHAHAAEEDHQGRHGADDDGVHEHLKDAEHTLLDGLPGVGAGVGDGAGAKAGLVGENAPGHALLHTQEEAAHDAAGDGRGLKGTLKNGGKHGWNRVNMDNNDAQRKDNVQQGHQRH